MDDIRHYQKIGLSLSKIPHAQVHIIARDTTYELTENVRNVFFHSLQPVSPTLIERFFSTFRILGLLLKIKPNFIVACTQELLFISVLSKFLFGSKLVYDIQENYAANTKASSKGNPVFRQLLATWIRAKENLLSHFIDKFWLAEKCYTQELKFLKNNYLILENKSLEFRRVNKIQLASKPLIHILFSGTLAVETGILEALELTEALHNLDSRYRLKIIGCCHQKDILKKLSETTKQQPYIDLKVSKCPLSHQEIQEEIFISDLAIISNRLASHIQNKYPTKLYEYMTAGLPLLLQKNEPWTALCHEFENHVSVDYQKLNPIEIHEAIQNMVFYPNGNLNAKKHTWQFAEEKILTDCLTRL